MSFIFEPIPLAPDDPQKEVAEADFLRQIYLAAFNLSFFSRDGAIQHGDKAGNFDAKYLIFTSNATVNTEDAILHGLNRIPKGYLITKQDKASLLYDSTTAWTNSLLYLKSSTAATTWQVIVY